MTKPACIPCGLFFTPTRNGLVVEEGMPNNHSTTARYIADDGTLWSSYKLWRCDEWTCRGCGAKIAAGYGAQPMHIQHEPDYAARREAWGGDDIPFIHDC